MIRFKLNLCGGEGKYVFEQYVMATHGGMEVILHTPFTSALDVGRWLTCGTIALPVVKEEQISFR
jgi:hypothetical protein